MCKNKRLLPFSIIFLVLSILASLNNSMKVVALVFLTLAVIVLDVQDGFVLVVSSLMFVGGLKYRWVTSVAYCISMFNLLTKAYILFGKQKRISRYSKFLIAFASAYAIVIPLVQMLVAKQFYFTQYVNILTILCAVLCLYYIYNNVNFRKLCIYLGAGLVLSCAILLGEKLVGLIESESIKSLFEQYHILTIFSTAIFHNVEGQFSSLSKLVFGQISEFRIGNLYISFMHQFGLVGIAVLMCVVTKLLIVMFKENGGKNYWFLALSLLISIFVGELFALAILACGLISSGDKRVDDSSDDKNKLRFGYYLILKRVFDIIVSLIGLVVASIPMIVVAFLIKTTSKGPVFFKDKRIGKDGKTITVLKFRSMYKDAEARLEQYLTKEQLEMWKKERKVDNDPRITKVGKFIRKTSLDELPQLFNILKGDLSIVGNRPLSKLEYDTYFNDEEKKLLDSMQPGLTGYWQAYGRSNVTFLSGERQKMYIYYPQNASVKLDIKIFFKTIAVVLKRDGAK